MKTIGTIELCDIINDVALSTLLIYLNNYRYTKFRKTYHTGAKAVYELCPDFLNVLYTNLIYRNRDRGARHLKDHFKDYNIKLLKYGEFVKWGKEL